MPSVTYDGQDYAAILSLSRLSVKLPIRSSWNRTALIDENYDLTLFAKEKNGWPAARKLQYEMIPLALCIAGFLTKNKKPYE